MNISIRVLAVSCLVLCLASPPANAGESYRKRTGLFGMIGLGMGQGNFKMATADSKEPDSGGSFYGCLGYAFTDRFAASVGVDGTVFSYEYATVLDDGTMDMMFTMVDVSGWYFTPLAGDWLKLPLRVGLGKTSVTQELNGTEIDSAEGSGLVASVGLEAFLSKGFALGLELYYRTWGVTLDGMDDKEVTTTGAMLNLSWR